MSHTENKAILIVEDNNDTRNLISDVLKIHGFYVDSALNGEQAVTMVSNKQYDVIFMDLMLPIMDGIEASKIILNSNPSQKIIVISACLSRENVKVLKSLGINTIIPKPFKISEILRAISENNYN